VDDLLYNGMDKKTLQNLVSRHLTWSAVVRELGLPLHGGNIANVKKKVKQFDIDTSHFVGKNHPRKYTKEVLEEAIRKSVSYSEMCKWLGVKWTGGLHAYLKKRISDYGIDIGHFLGKKANSGKRHKNGTRKKTPAEVLCKRTEGRRNLAYLLRRALIESGRSYVCESCGLGAEWNGKELVLQVHHKNGDWLDDRADNLRFECPNCHSQTNGWCNSKGLTETTTKRLNTAKFKRSK